MKRYLPALTIVFSLGIFFASKIRIFFWLLYAGALIFFLLTFFLRRKKFIFELCLLCLIFLEGAACLKNSQVLERRHVSKFIRYQDNQLYTIKGVVESQPVLKADTLFFVLRAEEIQSDRLNYYCYGNILVYLRGKKAFDYGDVVILSGSLFRPFRGQDNRGRSYRDYLYGQGIYGLLRVKSGLFALKLPGNRGFILKKIALWLKKKIEAVFFQDLSSLAASILAAMVLGEKRHIPPLINNAMVKSGTVHILAWQYTKLSNCSFSNNITL